MSKNLIHEEAITVVDGSCMANAIGAAHLLGITIEEVEALSAHSIAHPDDPKRFPASSQHNGQDYWSVYTLLCWHLGREDAVITRIVQAVRDVAVHNAKKGRFGFALLVAHTNSDAVECDCPDCLEAESD